MSKLINLVFGLFLLLPATISMMTAVSSFINKYYNTCGFSLSIAIVCFIAINRLWANS